MSPLLSFSEYGNLYSSQLSFVCLRFSAFGSSNCNVVLLLEKRQGKFSDSIINTWAKEVPLILSEISVQVYVYIKTSGQVVGTKVLQGHKVIQIEFRDVCEAKHIF